MSVKKAKLAGPFEYIDAGLAVRKGFVVPVILLLLQIAATVYASGGGG